MATAGELLPSSSRDDTQPQGEYAETVTYLQIESGLSQSDDVSRRSKALVEELLTQISEQIQREKFVAEMNNLDWCYIDWQVEDVAETMRRMGINEQKQLDGETKLFYSDCEAEMSNRIKEYSDELLTWTFISCPTTNSHMIKRIAIGEGDNNVRIIQMLDLSQTEDILNDRLGEFCVVEGGSNNPGASRTVTSLVVFGAPDERHAITYDDEKLMRWIVDSKRADKSSVAEITQSMRIDGKNLFHQCAIANSSNILQYLRTILSKGRLTASLKEEDGNGNTPIHLVAQYRNAAALHQLLSALDKSNLEQLLDKPNSQQQTVHKMVQDEINNKEVKSIIEYHRQLREDDQLMEFFDTFEFSLFAYELRPDREKIVHGRVEYHRPVNDPGAKRNVNLDAATCLLMNDTAKAKELIDRAIEIVPDDVHTWCNKGKYALLMGDQDRENHREAKNAAFQVIDLLTSKTNLPRIKAKIEYAYFIAEANRGVKDREESIRIFQECMMDLEPYTERTMVSLKAYCSYHYAKTLVRTLKSDDRYNKSSESIRDMLHYAFDQIALLDEWAKATDSEEYTADMWLWLAEVQFLHLGGDSQKKEVEEFKQRTGYENIEPETCLEKATEIAENNEERVEGKIRVHIARNVLKLAYDNFDKERRLYFLNKAQQDCEWWIENYYWTFESANTSAQALWQQWCTEIYFECNDLVKETFVNVRGGQMKIVHDKYGLEYVSKDFYHPRIKLDRIPLSITKKYLSKAKAHLDTLMDKPDGWSTNGAKYAKIMFLLDEHNNDGRNINEAFQKAHEKCSPGKWKTKVAEECGLYFAWIGNHRMAKLWFDLAVEEYEKETCDKRYKPMTGFRCLRILRRGQSFF